MEMETLQTLIEKRAVKELEQVLLECAIKEQEIQNTLGGIYKTQLYVKSYTQYGGEQSIYIGAETQNIFNELLPK